jgi:hypothetical protein
MLQLWFGQLLLCNHLHSLLYNYMHTYVVLSSVANPTVKISSMTVQCCGSTVHDGISAATAAATTGRSSSCCAMHDLCSCERKRVLWASVVVFVIV